MAEAVGCSGKELQFAEPLVDNLGRLVLEDPVGSDHEGQAEDHPHDGGNDYKDESFVPAFRDDDREDGGRTGVNGGVHHGRAGVAADEGMGRGGGKSPPPGE